MFLLHIGCIFAFCITQNALAMKNFTLEEMATLAMGGIVVAIDAEWVSNVDCSTYNKARKFLEVKQSVLLNGEVGPVDKLRLKRVRSPQFKRNIEFNVASLTETDDSGIKPGTVAFWFHDTTVQIDFEKAAAIPFNVFIEATNWQRTLTQSNEAGLEIVGLPNGNFGFRVKRQKFFLGNRPDLGFGVSNKLSKMKAVSRKYQETTKLNINFKNKIYVYLQPMFDGAIPSENIDLEAVDRNQKWHKASFKRVTLKETDEDAFQVSFACKEKSNYAGFRLKLSNQNYVMLEGTEIEWIFFTVQKA